MALDSLPTELQCSFIRLLDPIGLISLSQTSQHFRLLINPTKGHFVQRLLQMETLEEHGGPMPFMSLDPRFPDPVLDECKDVRWACTSCCRLLARRCFGNNFILKEAYQKVMRHSPLYNTPTTWEPVAERVPRPTIDQDAVLGSRRQFRTCLECQYHRGELESTSHYADGTTRVTFQENRKLLFYSELDRYFPGLSDFLGHQIPKVLETRVTGNRWKDSPMKPLSWSTWMVRCPSCSRWKELRNYRVQVHDLYPNRPSEIDVYPRFWAIPAFRGTAEDLFKGACCHACFAKANGRLELGHALGSWFRALIDRPLEEVSSNLKNHVEIFKLNLFASEGRELGQRLREVEATMPCFDIRHKVLNEKDIADLKAYCEYASGELDGMNTDEISPAMRDFLRDLAFWGECYKRCEDTLEKFKTLRKLSEDSAEAFAAWALDRDESTWDYEVEAALSREFGPYEKRER